MTFRLEELRTKEVISISDGERLGYIDDVEFDLLSCEAKSLVIFGRERFFGIFGKEDDIVIPCSDIKVVGNEVILVEHSCADYTDNNKCGR